MTHLSQGPTTRLLLITGGCIYPSLRYGVGSNPSLDRRCCCVFLHSHKVTAEKYKHSTVLYSRIWGFRILVIVRCRIKRRWRRNILEILVCLCPNKKKGAEAQRMLLHFMTVTSYRTIKMIYSE
jgi:hypothetical protein